MQVVLSMNKDTLIAKMSGELDHHSTEEVREKLERCIINKSAKNLIFDFTNLTFMDSSGIGMIIGRFKLISAMGGKVKIVYKSRQIDKLISMSGLKKIIKVYDDIEQAIESI